MFLFAIHPCVIRCCEGQALFGKGSNILAKSEVHGAYGCIWMHMLHVWTRYLEQFLHDIQITTIAQTRCSNVSCVTKWCSWTAIDSSIELNCAVRFSSSDIRWSGLSTSVSASSLGLMSLVVEKGTPDGTGCSKHSIHGAFPKWGNKWGNPPVIIHVKRIFHYKPSIVGVPQFTETLIWYDPYIRYHSISFDSPTFLTTPIWENKHMAKHLWAAWTEILRIKETQWNTESWRVA